MHKNRGILIKNAPALLPYGGELLGQLPYMAPHLDTLSPKLPQMIPYMPILMVIYQSLTSNFN